ncbi:MAG: hypothetical protein U9R72_00830 [Chloroflexota bacterium]|nr:hypothetical protein [Chloroflexota bacterium]
MVYEDATGVGPDDVVSRYGREMNRAGNYVPGPRPKEEKKRECLSIERKSLNRGNDTTYSGWELDAKPTPT